MIQKQLEDNDGISLDQHKDEIESTFNRQRQKLLANRLENNSKQQQSVGDAFAGNMTDVYDEELDEARQYLGM
ncbi:hypothetical protein EV177_005893, partial [Coemansia sp. RSA 1804]